MQATTSHATGSRTIADLLPRAAELFPDRVAVRRRVGDGEWRDTTFREVGEVVSEIGRGLIDLGVEPGERVAILCSTRPEWAYASFAISCAGGVTVAIYPTSSPDECAWVAGDSGAVAVVCEDASQVAKIVGVRERLPELRHLVAIDPAGAPPEAIALDEVRERGRRRDPHELARRAGAVSPRDHYTFMYTSGTTGPPKGCVLSHANYRAVVDAVNQREVLRGEDDVVYLFLPLAHAFALLIQLAAWDLGTPIAYYGGDVRRIVQELGEVKPTYLPSVPRLFEKIHTLVTNQGDPARIRQAVEVGRQVRDLQVAGRSVPAPLQQAFEQADAALFANVRAVFGGRLREAATGAAPIQPEILELFWACGVPVMEGYGMTETATVATTSTPEAHRFGTVGRALPGVEIRIADDGEVLVRGPNVFQGYWRNDDASFGAVVDGWLQTGDLGSLDEDGYLTITGRKKDIIITSGGKNITPANLENDLTASRWISHAVMHGDRRPYPVALIALDEEEILAWARERGKPEDVAALTRDPEVRQLVQEVVDEANRRYAPVAQIKRFHLLDHDLSVETGELTPTLKVKRSVVQEKYADALAALYD
jgi:long-chain acyl-CoA synthetase